MVLNMQHISSAESYKRQRLSVVSTIVNFLVN